ncbi:MAG: VPLPA-CTERM sorting domain-containing protein [Pseudomonadota bacterium]
MKKVLLALGFTFIATSAQAVTVGSLQLNSYGSTMFNGTNNVVNTNTGIFGQLSTTQNTTLKFTFLGKEAGNTNSLLLNNSVATGSSTNTAVVNDSFTLNANAGVIDFGFTGNGGLTASNTTNPQENIVFLENVDSIVDAAGNPFAFLVGFNDGGSDDADFDDYVVGINEVSPVPVPAAAWLFGSALFGFASFRRHSI